MRKTLYLLITLFTLSLSANALPSLVPSPPRIDAKAYLLMDHHSGTVLAEKNADKRIEPASLTKLMTAYIVAYEIERGSISMDDEVLISVKAWRMKGSKMFIREGTHVSVDKLLKGLIIQSGNDAAVALAEHVAGSEEAFVELMNQHAQRLGMTSTHFNNSTGWPDKNHYTTVRDLAKLTRAVINDFPEHYAVYKIKEYTYNNIRQSNRNGLLWRDDRVDGLKTGHTEAAGYCLIASAKQNDMRLISIVMGTSSDAARIATSRKLINYGFRFFDTRLLHKANEPVTNIRIWKGEEEELPLGIEKDLYITIPKGQYKKLKTLIKLDALIEAPAKKGQAYGDLEIMLGDKLLLDRKLVALKDIKQGGIWRKMVDSIKLWFQ